MENKLMHVQIDKIDFCEYGIREACQDDAQQDLVESIRDKGIISPVLLKEENGRYIVIAGHRRVTAAKTLKHSKIPAQITTGDEKENFGAMFAENMVRKDMTVMEEAAAIAEWLSNNKDDYSTLGRILNKSQSWITDRLKLLTWPDDVTLAIHQGKLSVSAAKNLALIQQEDARKMLVQYAIDNGATARTTAAWYQEHLNGRPVVEPGEFVADEMFEVRTPMIAEMPCVICDGRFKVHEVQYMPICPPCNENMIDAVRRNQSKG